MKLCYLIWPLIIVVSLCKSGKVLIVPMGLNASHLRSMLPIAVELARRGHNVSIWMSGYEIYNDFRNEVNYIDTIISTNDRFKLDAYKFRNATEIFKPVMDLTEPGSWWFYVYAWEMGIDILKDNFEQHRRELDQIIKRNWDLIIVDTIFAPGGYWVLDKFNSTTTAFLPHTTAFVTPSNAYRKGVPMPIGSYPQAFATLQNPANFFWRFFVAYEHFVSYLTDLAVSRRIRGLLTKYDLQSTGYDVQRLENRADMHLTSIGQDFDFPRPSQHNFLSLETECIDHQVKELPDAMEEFIIDSSSEGTIIIAFGHIVNWNSMPDFIVEALVQTFHNLPKYRFIWQSTLVRDLRLPSNVLMSKWIPQSDLLHHPKTVAFLTHGGYKSVHEATCAAVPLVAMPIFAEQPRNAYIIENRWNTGRSIYKYDVTATALTGLLKDVARNKIYASNALKRLKMIKDKIKRPTEETVDRIEQTLAKNTDWVRPQCEKLNWIQRNSIDVIFMLTITPLIFASSVYKSRPILRWIFQCIVKF